MGRVTDYWIYEKGFAIFTSTCATTRTMTGLCSPVQPGSEGCPPKMCVDAATLGLKDVRAPTWELFQILPNCPFIGSYLLRAMSPYHHAGSPAHRVFS